MIKSMTGYGRAEAIVQGKRMVVEIKSLNHRYLETSLRLPNALSPLELEIKKKINTGFSRGKIEASVRFDAVGSLEKGALFDLNISLLNNYYSLLCRIKKELGLQDEITLTTMAGFRDIFIALEDDDSSVYWQQLEGILDEAMTALTAMREREGESLGHDLGGRIDVVKQLLDGIEKRVPQVLASYQRRLTERVRELVENMEIDESRLMQEVAIMAEKSDIMEEIVRLHSHIDQFLQMIGSNEAVGRKIDFLIQEMGREVNTIGSKSSDVEIVRNVIEIKSELARIREQVQNIE